MFRERTFRLNFVALGLLAMAVLLLLAPLIGKPGMPLVLDPVFWIGPTLLFAWLWLTVWATCWFFPTYVGPDGVRSYNGFGVYADVPWASMRSVGRIPGYLFVKHAGRRGAIWVPTAFVDREGLAEAFSEYAPEDNPLRRAFARSVRARR